MRQVVQDFGTGEARLVDVPPPALPPAFVRVRVHASVVSPGTERALLALGRKSLLAKARARPDLVAKVWRKWRREGLRSAVRTVRDRLGAPMPLGYAAAGVAIEVGRRAGPRRPGERLACAGAGYAVHADEIVVPRNLVAVVPDAVPFEDAAFATLGAIALQSLRAADVRVGERVAVVGTGLLGALVVRLARASGARVLAVDPDAARRDRARADGAEVVASPEDAPEAARAWTGRVGVDAVVVAAASSEDGPATLAGELVRRAGVVSMLGDVPLRLPRRLYYAKEATVRLATSYGPGRYDRAYEEGGRDYPLAYVRWTAGRNLEAFLALLASGTVRVADLADRRPIDEAAAVYAALVDAGLRGRTVAFDYGGPGGFGGDAARDAAPTSPPAAPPGAAGSHGTRTALVGAGAFARTVLWPALSRAGLAPAVVANATGASAKEAAKRLGFPVALSDADAAIARDDVDVVVVATPHHLHAPQVRAALHAGRHVFCEKPLAITVEGLASVEDALRGARGVLAVGFNRRFSEGATLARDFLRAVPGPTLLAYRVNAGPLPDGTWLSDPATSGGRLVGEACHMVDLSTFLCGETPVRVRAVAARGADGAGDDSAALTVEFSGGSVASIVYGAMGDASAGKERVEATRGDRGVVLEDWRRLSLHRDGRTRSRRLLGDKGHLALAAAFVAAVRSNGPPPIPYAELFAVTRATFAAVRSLRSGRVEDA